ncbi:hypothetical protein DFQ28_008733 [Apophysomyces sp. BC1034]|nr:hypothetical protein DFQ30_010542 [Apophysomyces sp. BC1015]KAG0180505.1 hypothetical protein DFQ29_000547 [Apophysomyces sp. BC1021]KAG0185816.1 hypothetical protein DFQ28_008733 [Apophysomyces sp. BC1034]
MRRGYASSVYSQKSTTSAKSTASAKSGRSFLSMNAFVWPTTSKDDNLPLNGEKQGLWKNLKAWMPAKRQTRSAKDTDSIAATTVSSSSSVGSSSSSYLKLKRLFITPAQMIKLRSDDKKSPPSSVPDDSNDSSIETCSVSDKLNAPTGILLNRGDSAEALAEQKRRRKERRQYLRQIQSTNNRFRPMSGPREMGEDEDATAAAAVDPPRRRQVSFGDALPVETSSSSTILLTPPDATPKDEKDEAEDDRDSWLAGPRVTFVEPSPVPRFRNVPPAPPPSPPYLNIIAQPSEDVDGHGDDDDGKLKRKNSIQSVISASIDNVPPTVFTTLPRESQGRALYMPWAPRKSQLCFQKPLSRGQTVMFSLQNAIPDEHVIVFKFLTSNAKLTRKKGDFASPWIAPTTGSGGSLMERYFVRPSAGRMVSTDQASIMLFLNQVPPSVPGEILKDKILVRWAVIQRHTQVDAWVQSLSESTRRKWLEMLIEQWPDQVMVRETRIKIRFA